MSKLIDLSHTVTDGIRTYPGLPAPSIETFLSHEDSLSTYTNGTQFHIGKIRMVMNTGTYVDSPFHRYPEATDISGLPLERLANLKAVVIPVSGTSIGADALEQVDFEGCAVLVHTGWSRHWGTPQYFEGHPFLTAEAADCLVSNGAVHVGIDSLNIDDSAGGTRPVHSTLLAAGIPITEHLTRLSGVPSTGARYFAVPAKISGAGSFTVRAFALIP